MQFEGEHLLPGQIGHFFVLLAFVASIISTIAFFTAGRKQDLVEKRSWLRFARAAFITQLISAAVIFSIIFYICSNHYFEYMYAYKHASKELEPKYLLACIWEGQEGSFLLWTIWHSILGIFIMLRSKEWEAPVMTVISLAQVFLMMMLLGLYVFDVRMGSSPFTLTRNEIAGPIFSQPNYLSFIKDGVGLNVLLRNYWMVIHPPVLFMGFASTIVPFAFAMAGLWKKQYGEWTKPALPWALFSAAVLGVGIMMGGMWAYESLTFGGYWAWDPVENASLVPWMILVSGIHTLLIYRHSGHSLRATYLFFILAFGFILYSTFLTRSGILGESSVHAFTDLGMNFQLLTFLLIFVLPSLAFFFARYNKIPSVQKEENTSSREFWMFIGALVFFLSAIVIIGKTSLPVFNKIFGTNIAPPEDAEFAYNSIQIYVAIIMAALTAVSQYLKYKDTSGKYFWKKILIPTIITLILSALFIVFGDIDYNKKGPVFQGSIWLAVVCSIYTIVANAGYIWLGLKGNLKLSGGSISHVGFGMVLLGILISSSNKEILSNNIGGIPAPLAEGEDPRENLTLVKDMTANMGRYSLTYEGDSAHPKKQQWYYKVRFKSNDGKEEFVLLPNAFVNYKGNEGLMANPSAKHYWDHDVFTYITSIPNPENEKDTSSFKPFTRKTGDSLFYSRGFIIIQDVKQKDSIPEELFGADGTLYEVPLKIYSKTGSTYSVTSRLANAKGEWFAIPDTITSESLVLQLQKVNPDKTIEMGVKESSAVLKYVTLKAYRFPFIKLLWYGVWITAIGILISMVRRIQLNRKNTVSS